MAETTRNGRGEGTSMFGLLLPVLVVLVLALILNAFSEVPAAAPEITPPAAFNSDTR